MPASSKEYVEHLFRESLREHHLEALEKWRPRLFGGMGTRLDRELTLSELVRYATELDRSLLRGVMAGRCGPWTERIGEAYAGVTGAPTAIKDHGRMRTTSCGGVRPGNQHGTPSYRSSCYRRGPSSWGRCHTGRRASAFVGCCHRQW